MIDFLTIVKNRFKAFIGYFDKMEHIFYRNYATPLTAKEWSTAHLQLYSILKDRKMTWNNPVSERLYLLFIKHVIANIPKNYDCKNIDAIEFYFTKIIHSLVLNSKYFDEVESCIHDYFDERRCKQIVFNKLLLNVELINNEDVWTTYGLSIGKARNAVSYYQDGVKDIQNIMKNYCTYFPISKDVQYKIAVLSLTIFEHCTQTF